MRSPPEFSLGVEPASPTMQQTNCVWMRPDLMNLGCEIIHYVRDSIVGEVCDVLSTYAGQGTFDAFRDGPFGVLLQVEKKASPSKVLHEVLAREVTHPSLTEFEKVFHVGGKYIRLGPQDYALVTGLMFGESDFNPNATHHVPETSLLRKKYKEDRIRVSRLRWDFKNGNLETDVDYLKAAKLLVYYLILSCRDNPWIEDWVWALVEDQAAWDSFPWGSYSFQILCHQIAVIPKERSDIRKGCNTYLFFGPLWALHSWAFEAVPELGYLIGRRTSDILTPRFRRWIILRPSLECSDMFEDFQLRCNFSLVPGSSELCKQYFISSDSPNALAVKYVPPRRDCSICSGTLKRTRELSSKEDGFHGDNRRARLNLD